MRFIAALARARSGWEELKVSEPIDESLDFGAEGTPVSPEDIGHPWGTLAIVILYGLLFALSWLGLYVYQFLGRGAPRP